MAPELSSEPSPAPALAPAAEPPLLVPAWANLTWPPPRVRVYASRRGLRAGFLLAAVLAAGGIWTGQGTAVAAGVLLAAACALRWAARLPVIEFSEMGTCLFINGPYCSPFFAPWERIRSARRIHFGRGPEGAVVRASDALGIEFEAAGDSALAALPVPPAGARMPLRGSAPGELAWPARLLDGNLDRLLESIEPLRRAQLPTPGGGPDASARAAR